MELKAYQDYKDPELPITFWRTSTGQEVDFVLGDREVGIEIKGSSRVHENDTRALRAFREEGKTKRAFIICLESQRRVLSDGTEVLPWRDFLEELWAGEIV